MTLVHVAPNSPGPSSRTRGGPSPPAKTAVEIPADCMRRSCRGIGAKILSRSEALSKGSLFGVIARANGDQSLLILEPVRLETNLGMEGTDHIERNIQIGRSRYG